MPDQSELQLEAQPSLDLRPDETVGVAYQRILDEATSPAQKGRWFEHLFMECVQGLKEFEVADIWTWRDWPDRLAVTGRDGRDWGVDLVAELRDGSRVAIQCKCYADPHRVSKNDVAGFVAESRPDWFDLRWVVSTSDWTVAAESAIKRQTPPVRRIDFLNYMDREIREFQEPVRRDPKLLQIDAIEAVCDGLLTQGNDRGKLIMACGTGKTYVSLKVAERLVPDDGCILFAAPSISLVSQARREWLTYTERPMASLVVCSDETAGGSRARFTTAGTDSVVCRVSTEPRDIANHLRAEGGIRVIFSTYHSLSQVAEAQGLAGVPPFDLAIADEAHRTTGVNNKEGGKVDFQLFHDQVSLSAKKRLYMTATPRVYTGPSKAAMLKKGFKFTDMRDVDTFGPELHRLKFKEAVAHDELSDYRVIVLGVHESLLTPYLTDSVKKEKAVAAKVELSDMARLFGTALAMNGYVEGNPSEKPDKLPRTIAYARSIARSKWYVDMFNDPQLKSAVSRSLEGDERGMKTLAVHLDAKHSALERANELRLLNEVHRKNEARLLSNVRIFTEGVDVPALDAVSFLDPRSSEVDILQSIGRVMRKAVNKNLGYVIVPVCIPQGEDNLEGALVEGSDGYESIGKVLRALQSHDERLSDSIADVVMLCETDPLNPKAPRTASDTLMGDADDQGMFTMRGLDFGSIYMYVVAASGLGNPGERTAQTIEEAVKVAADYLEDDIAAIDIIRKRLELSPDTDIREVAIVAALLLCNACLMHKRLKSEAEGMSMLIGLDSVARAGNPVETLAFSWEQILAKDFQPIFRPALAVAQAVTRSSAAKKAAQVIAECANNLADQVGDLGYDHAGPLYHRILRSVKKSGGTEEDVSKAKSDGAYYTEHIPALMLAGLALSPDMVNWADREAVQRLRILDPACGTGTLLMAALKTVKDRALASGSFAKGELPDLHRHLVQNGIHGLDINYAATQLAASSLTLGAPSIDYESMGINTMQHGPQPDGSVKIGSLELLLDAVNDVQTDIMAHAKQAPLMHDVKTQVPNFPRTKDVDVVLTNPPFTYLLNRNTAGGATTQLMRDREDLVKERVTAADPLAGNLIDKKSLSTFFTPLSDAYVKEASGTYGVVNLTSACTAVSVGASRKMLAGRFHLDVVVTSHDPRQINFSEGTNINESLLVFRRRNEANRQSPTRFVSLRKMPKTATEVESCLEEMMEGTGNHWCRVFNWPRSLVAQGDWTPALFYDGTVFETFETLRKLPGLATLGSLATVQPGSESVSPSLVNPNEEEIDFAAYPKNYPIMWNHDTEIRRAMHAQPEYQTVPKPDKEIEVATKLWPKARNLLVARRLYTSTARTASIFVSERVLGSGWSPITPSNEVGDPIDAMKAWCTYLNSSVGTLFFLLIRDRKLTYPRFNPSQLRSLLVPDPVVCDIQPLVRAYDDLQDTELMPWPAMDTDPNRLRLDDAVAEVLDLDSQEVSEWRQRIVNEPFVSGSKAKH